jgi:hypothetical protein
MPDAFLVRRAKRFGERRGQVEDPLDREAIFRDDQNRT